jgi:hypothetical protein
MFIGHFAAGFAGKKLAPRASLGTFVAAGIFLDILWPVFLLSGIEIVKIVPGLLPFSPFDFVSYPWSHSLLAAAFWSCVFGGVYQLFRRDAATAKVLGAVVFSHWVLDWVTHRPDLPLSPGVAFKTGLGLWQSVPATVAIEGVLFLLAVWWYARSTEPLDRVGRWALITLVAVLLAFYAASIGSSPQPGQERTIAYGSIAILIFIPWAAWIDRHRVVR